MASASLAAEAENEAELRTEERAAPAVPRAANDALSPALGSGAPGRFSAAQCPQALPYSAPMAPSLGLSASGSGSSYGATYGENYGAAPGSVIEQSNAVLGQACIPSSGR
jgi:hypothetical protein